MRDLASEPTMEEILASIRRIIAEDGQLPADAVAQLKSVGNEDEIAEAQPVANAVPPHIGFRPVGGTDDDDDEVLELTEPAAPEPEPAEELAPMTMVQPIDMDEPLEFEQEPAVPAKAAAGLVDEQVAAASAERLAALSPFAGAAPPATDNPFEALVRDMVRPMLKDWLDANLPNIVEKLVSQEIIRITGKGS